MNIYRRLLPAVVMFLIWVVAASISQASAGSSIASTNPLVQLRAAAPFDAEAQIFLRTIEQFLDQRGLSLISAVEEEVEEIQEVGGAPIEVSGSAPVWIKINNIFEATSTSELDAYIAQRWDALAQEASSNPDSTVHDL
jgi:hypothetical protein